MVLISVNQMVKIPRSPPGPSYIAKDKSLKSGVLSQESLASQKAVKYYLFVLHPDEQLGPFSNSRTNEALQLLSRLTKPDGNSNLSSLLTGADDALGSGLQGAPYDFGQSKDAHEFLSEEEIIKSHVQSIQKKHMDFLKDTETQYKGVVRELRELANLGQLKLDAHGNDENERNVAQMSTHLYKIKQVVKRVTMEGEHTCLMLLQHDQTMAHARPLSLEIVPIMNAPYQNANLQIELDDIRIVHLYRYMFQYKALRVVTVDGREYIFEFQKVKHANKALEVLIGNAMARQMIPQEQVDDDKSAAG